MSTKDETRQLNSILGRSIRASQAKYANQGQMPRVLYDCTEDSPEDDFTRGLVQWTSSDGKKFVPASGTVAHLRPGAYEVKSSQNVGIYFELIDVKTEGLVRFPDTNSDKVIAEITKFWDRQKLFEEYGINHKRGICLWGPAGSGKSCTIQFIMKDVIARGGVVIKFTNPSLFIAGIRILREIQPDTPVVVLMEDLDSIIQTFCESDVLNLLDGVDRVERIVFLATTNYPEDLGPRIINRPSRFDQRFFIGHPKPDARRIYFRHLIKGKSDLPDGPKLDIYVDKKAMELNIDLDKWVDETDDFSIAHLKELFTTVVIQGNPFHEAVETLRSMRNKIHGDHDEIDSGGFGFGR